MKRYLLFCSQTESTEGGWDDLTQDSDDFQELKTIAHTLFNESEAERIPGTVPAAMWAHIVDTQTGKKKLTYTEDLGWCAT